MPARAAIVFFASEDFLRKGFLRDGFLPRIAFFRGAAFFLDFLALRALDLLAICGCYHGFIVLTIGADRFGPPPSIALDGGSDSILYDDFVAAVIRDRVVQ